MPEFGIVQALALTGFAALIVGASARIPRLWGDRSTTTRIFSTMKSWWPWGDPLLRGWIRALPAGLVGGWCGVGSGIVAALLATDTVGWRGWFLVLALLVVLLFTALFLAATIMLANWPRFAVPPHLREQRGALAEWRSARARRPSAP